MQLPQSITHSLNHRSGGPLIHSIPLFAAKLTPPPLWQSNCFALSDLKISDDMSKEHENDFVNDANDIDTDSQSPEQMTDDRPEATDKTSPSESEAAEQKLKAELQEQKDKYLRLYSEFENFRRRTAREKQELIRTAGEEMAVSLLSVLDDFERAIKAFDAEKAEGNSTWEGLLLIYTKLKSTLERKGVNVMNIEAGSEFDAEYQEAITQIPAPDDSLRGKVVEVIEKGYTMGDKVIRFAKVVIGA
jgi:molecular chaperone GrpE